MLIESLLLLVLSSATILADGDRGLCGDNWRLYNGNCYTVVPGERSPSGGAGFNYMSGELYCARMAAENGPNHVGHLASIHSQADQQFIDGLLREQYTAGTLGRTSSFRIGLFSTDRSLDTVSWSDASPVDYGMSSAYRTRGDRIQGTRTLWYDDEPQADGERHLTEGNQCVLIRYGERELEHGGGRWARGLCHTTAMADQRYHGIICQSTPRNVFCAEKQQQQIAEDNAHRQDALSDHVEQRPNELTKRQEKRTIQEEEGHPQAEGPIHQEEHHQNAEIVQERRQEERQNVEQRPQEEHRQNAEIAHEQRPQASSNAHEEHQNAESNAHVEERPKQEPIQHREEQQRPMTPIIDEQRPHEERQNTEIKHEERPQAQIRQEERLQEPIRQEEQRKNAEIAHVEQRSQAPIVEERPQAQIRQEEDRKNVEIPHEERRMESIQQQHVEQRTQENAPIVQERSRVAIGQTELGNGGAIEKEQLVRGAVDRELRLVPEAERPKVREERIDETVKNNSEGGNIKGHEEQQRPEAQTIQQAEAERREGTQQIQHEAVAEQRREAEQQQRRGASSDQANNVPPKVAIASREEKYAEGKRLRGSTSAQHEEEQYRRDQPIDEQQRPESAKGSEIINKKEEAEQQRPQQAVILHDEQQPKREEAQGEQRPKESENKLIKDQERPRGSDIKEERRQGEEAKKGQQKRREGSGSSGSSEEEKNQRKERPQGTKVRAEEPERPKAPLVKEEHRVEEDGRVKLEEKSVRVEAASASALAVAPAFFAGGTCMGDALARGPITDRLNKGIAGAKFTPFYLAAGPGACGFDRGTPTKAAAVSARLFSNDARFVQSSCTADKRALLNDPICMNKCVRIAYQGKTLTVPITDKCLLCEENHVDLTKEAYQWLESGPGLMATGGTITFTECT